MSDMHRIFQCLIRYCLLISMCIGSIQAKTSGQNFCLVEARDYPGKDPFMWDGLYAASDGRVYTGLISEGAGAHFYVYEPEKDANRMIADMGEFFDELGKGIRTTAKIHNQPVEGPDGSIYFVTMNNGSGPRNIDYTSWIGGYWLRYDPRTDTLEKLGLVDQGIGLYPLTIDPAGKYLYGLGFTGYFYRFDIRKGKTKNLLCQWGIMARFTCWPGSVRHHVRASFTATIQRPVASRISVFLLPTAARTITGGPTSLMQ